MGAREVPCILAGVCEHAHSEHAVRYAAEWAQMLRGEVVAVHIRRLMPWVLCPYETACLSHDWQDACEQLAVERAVRVLAAGAVPWRVVSRPGGVAQGLAAEASAQNAAAIVVGAGSPKRSGRLPRGSVARTLRRAARVSVIAVGENGVDLAPYARGALNPTGRGPLARLRGSVPRRLAATPAGPLADLPPELLAAMSRRERRDTERAIRSVRATALR